jgi:hypothetical protein
MVSIGDVMKWVISAQAEEIERWKPIVGAW